MFNLFFRYSHIFNTKISYSVCIFRVKIWKFNISAKSPLWRRPPKERKKVSIWMKKEWILPAMNQTS